MTRSSCPTGGIRRGDGASTRGTPPPPPPRGGGAGRPWPSARGLALEAAEDVSPLAAAVGAANTLLRRDGRWFADNTDVGAMADALREAGVERPGSAVILGAGCIAQVALAALREMGVEEPVALV